MRRWQRRNIVTDHFVEWNGKPVTSIKVGFKRAVALAGISGKVTPHSLRHTAVSLLKDAGIPDAVVMALVGHDTVAMSRHYTHVGQEALERAAAELPTL